MLLCQVIATLTVEGFPCSPDGVHYAISRGKIPKPPLDAGHRYVFGAEHLEALREHFKTRKSCKQSPKVGV